MAELEADEAGEPADSDDDEAVAEDQDEAVAEADEVIEDDDLDEADLPPLPSRSSRRPKVDARRRKDDPPAEEPEIPAVAETESEDAEADAGAETESLFGLPVRKRGGSLAERPAPAPSKVENRAPTENSADAANNFSSMLSAFSTGINQGLEDADETDSKKGDD